MDAGIEHSGDRRSEPLSEGSSQSGGAGAEVMIIGHEPSQARGAKPIGRTEAISHAGRGFLQSASRGRAPVMAITAALAAALIGLVGLLVVAAATDSEWKRCPSQGRGLGEAQELRTLAAAEFQAFVTADSSQLDDILASEFTLITPAGDAWSRQKLLMSVESGELNFRTFQPRSTIEIRLDCEAAVLTYRSEIDVTFGSMHFRHEARHVDGYERRDGRWLKVWAQTTAVGGFPPPGQ
jgi:hypothetical protein